MGSADAIPHAAGIVLAGGRSSRMGAPKAALEWHGSTLLARLCAVLAGGIAGPVIVVGSPGQPLPMLPSGVRVVEDPREGMGPVQGLAAGLAAAAGEADTAFVCATDLPFLHAAFVWRVLAGFTPDVDIVVPVVGGCAQPLAAGYRTALAPRAAAHIAQGRLRLLDFVAGCRCARLDEAALLADPALAGADPALRSVLDVNDPVAYQSARRESPGPPSR